MKIDKKHIPNIITSTRLLGALAVPVVFYLLSKSIAVTTLAISAMTDGIDGYLARKWNAQSELGRKLDAFADKILAGAGLGIVISITPLAIANLVLEAGVAAINVYSYNKGYNPTTLRIGKTKTVALFGSICLGTLATIIPAVTSAAIVALSVTALLQGVTLGAYLKELNKNKKREENNISQSNIEQATEVKEDNKIKTKKEKQIEYLKGIRNNLINTNNHNIEYDINKEKKK